MRINLLINIVFPIQTPTKIKSLRLPRTNFLYFMIDFAEVLFFPLYYGTRFLMYGNCAGEYVCL